MKGISVVALIASIALATYFFVWRITGFQVAALPISRIGDWVLMLAYIFGAVGFLAAVISTKITEGAFAVIGGLAGTAAALFALLQIVVEHKRSVDAATLQVFNNIGANQPPNSRFCRCAFYHLLAAKDREPLDRLLAREEVSLTDDVLEWTNRCFADLNNSERTDLLADKKLTKKGASVLGSRIGRVLSMDDDIAFSIYYGVAREENLSELTNQSSEVARRIAKLYEEKMGFEGFANLQRIRTPYVYQTVCKDKRGFATKN